MDDLIAFLRAQLDDLEAKVEACEENIGRERAGEPYDDGSGIAERDDFPSYPWGVGDAELAYMAAVHPRVTRADVEAKRQVLDDYERRCHEAETNPALELECRLIRSVIQRLALPYAGHPGFREEWKP